MFILWKGAVLCDECGCIMAICNVLFFLSLPKRRYAGRDVDYGDGCQQGYEPWLEAVEAGQYGGYYGERYGVGQQYHVGDAP